MQIAFRSFWAVASCLGKRRIESMLPRPASEAWQKFAPLLCFGSAKGKGSLLTMVVVHWRCIKAWTLSVLCKQALRRGAQSEHAWHMLCCMAFTTLHWRWSTHCWTIECQDRHQSC